MSSPYVWIPVDFGSPIAVSSPTPILPWTFLGDRLDSGVLTVSNKLNAVPLIVVVDVANDPDGTPIASLEWNIEIPAGMSDVYQIGPKNLNGYLMASAYTKDGSPGSVTFQLKMGSRY